MEYGIKFVTQVQCSMREGKSLMCLLSYLTYFHVYLVFFSFFSFFQLYFTFLGMFLCLFAYTYNVLPQWKTLQYKIIIYLKLSDNDYNSHNIKYLAAGTDAINDEDFKQSWIRRYLESHPKFQGQKITETLLEKWISGFNKGAYVSKIS